MDSGATGHMCNNPKLFLNQKRKQSSITTAQKGATMYSPFSGEIESANCTLMDTNYVPGLTKNLLSVSKATAAGTSVIFQDEEVLF